MARLLANMICACWLVVLERAAIVLPVLTKEFMILQMPCLIDGPSNHLGFIRFIN